MIISLSRIAQPQKLDPYIRNPESIIKFEREILESTGSSSANIRLNCHNPEVSSYLRVYDFDVAENFASSPYRKSHLDILYEKGILENFGKLRG